MYSTQISIIIVNYNTSDLLINCINSIYENAGSINFETIVIDNNSTDDSVARVRKLLPQIKIIVNDQNVGFAKANNQAIKKSVGEVILLLNSDTVILDKAIDKSYQFLRDYPDAGIVSCKLLNPDRSLQPSCRSFPSVLNYFSESFFLYKLLPHSRIFGKPYMTFFKYDEIKKVDVVMGAFMMIRRNVFNDIGFLDEDFFMYSEETDFCLRAHRQGWGIYFYPDAEIIHLGGGSSAQLPTKMFLELHKSQMRFCYKHHPMWYARAEKIVILFGVLLRYAHAQIKYMFSKEENHIQRKNKYLTVMEWYIKGF